KDVVDKDDDKLVQVRSKYTTHHVHENCRCICKSKWHHGELVMSTVRHECSLRDIFLADSQLVITRPEVDLREKSCSLKHTKQLVDPWHRKSILYGHRI